MARDVDHMYRPSMGQLDASIVQLTLPVLERDLHATLASASWVAIRYLLSYSATLPVLLERRRSSARKLLYTKSNSARTHLSEFLM
jgi:hypothetical protein